MWTTQRRPFWCSASGVAVPLLSIAAILGAIMVFWSHLFDESVAPAVLPTEVGVSLPGPDGGPFAEARRRMVEEQLRGRDIVSHRVLQAMGRVPREEFVPRVMRGRAYADYPLPIGLGQTISQPYIVALMSQLAHPTPSSRALEIGVGSGYQAAVLGELCQEVYGIEILPSLADEASTRLKALGYKNVTVRCGDGYWGWPEQAPFDVILMAAAPDHVPPPLIEQLAPGGRMVLPLGHRFQELLLIRKRQDGSIDRQNMGAVQFVPMTGEAAETH